MPFIEITLELELNQKLPGSAATDIGGSSQPYPATEPCQYAELSYTQMHRLSIQASADFANPLVLPVFA